MLLRPSIVKSLSNVRLRISILRNVDDYQSFKNLYLDAIDVSDAWALMRLLLKKEGKNAEVDQPYQD